MKRSVEIAATSRADDLALRALAEIVAITSDENVRIVGGQMVALLMAGEPIEIAARIELLSNATMEFVARVPTVEMAVVIKAFT